MDPFSITVGIVSLLDVSFKVVKYLKNIEESSRIIEEEVTALISELNSLITLTNSINDLWQSNQEALTQESERIRCLWEQIGSLLKDCQQAVGNLLELLVQVIGKHGPTVSTVMDGFKKVLRKDSVWVAFLYTPFSPGKWNFREVSEKGQGDDWPSGYYGSVYKRSGGPQEGRTIARNNGVLEY